MFVLFVCEEGECKASTCHVIYVIRVTNNHIITPIFSNQPKDVHIV